MEDTVTVRMIDGELGVVFSRDMLKRLDVAEGDTLFVEETGEGLVLATRDPRYQRVMDRYRRGARAYGSAE